MPKFLTAPVPHEEGAEFIRNKPALTRAVFDQLAPELQARAFVITGVESLDAVARVREKAARLPLGGDYDDLKEEILAELSPWLITETDAEEKAKQIGAANRRAEMLLRMHGWQAYAQTQHELMDEHADVFEYRQYLSSEDGQVRPHHEALNKKILPANHVFWHNHTPPWEFNCRCDVVPLTREEAEEIDASESRKAPEDKQLMPPEQIRELEDNGRIVKPGGQGFLDIRTPRERTGKGFEFRPADNALDIDQILERFTPSEKAAFEDFAARQRLEDGRTLLDWWKSGAAPTPAPGPAPASPSPIAGPSSSPAGPTPPPVTKTVKRGAHPTERMRAKIANAAYKSERDLSAGVNTTKRVKNGVEIVFKSAAGEAQQVMRLGIRPGEQYKREKAASLIDQYLGTDLVPPTEIITYKGEIGSAQQFKGGWTEVFKRHQNGNGVNFDRETERRMSLLDDVTGNLDRHGGNLMARKRPGTAFDNVIMIDNGLCLSSHPEASGTRFPVPLSGEKLDAKSRRQLDDFLAKRSEWEPEVESLVGKDAVGHMLDRIDRLKKKGFGKIAPRLL